MRKFKELTNQEIISAIETEEYLGSILRALEVHDNTSNRQKLKQFIKDNNIDTSHIKVMSSRIEYEKNPKRCKYCNEIIPYEKRQNDFCGRSCAASYNNLGIVRNGTSLPEHSYCLNCGKEITRGNKYCDNSCQKCGWHEVNPYTGLVPLQIHHIDGDCTNNREENLQLLCPNCHSLTENFGSRNKNCTRIDKRVR